MSTVPYETVDTQYKVEFNQQVHILAQERMSKLAPFVKMVDFSGEDFAYDRFGQLTSQEIVERFKPIQLTDVAWDRRWVAPSYFGVAVGVDGKDIDKMKRNPGPELAQACVDEMMRRKDQVLYKAAFADVRVGKTGASATAVTFANDGGQTIDATGGFGLSTLKRIKRNFVDNAVATDLDVNVALTVDGTRIENLMGETQLTSSDYVNNKPLVKGTMGEAYGIKLIPYASGSQAPLLTSSGGERNLLALAEGGLILAGGIINIRIEKRPDMHNDVTQIVAEMCIAALRPEGARVQKIRVAA